MIRRLAFLLIGVLAVAGGIVVGVRVLGGDACAVETVEDPRSPLQSVARMKAAPDEDRDALATALGSAPEPFGELRAGLDYYYDQYLHLYGVNGGVLAWTNDNAPVTYLDDGTLKPRWSLRPATKRTAWDTSQDRFLLLGLSKSAPVTVSSHDLRSGEQKWCAELSGKQRAGEPVGTAFLPGGDVVVALPATRDRIQVSRLAGDDGKELWSRTVTAGRADFVDLVGDVLVVGGEEEFRLAAAPSGKQVDNAVVTLDPSSGRQVVAWGGGDAGLAHVVGATGSTMVVTTRLGEGVDLAAVDDQLAERWTVRLPDGAYEATLRGDVVLTRTRTSLDAYDAGSGKVLWRRALPQDRTYFPYGFALGQMPSLDGTHVLVPTTSSLEILDVTDGTSRSVPLPTDGVSSTYWPYQLLATPKHLGVLTNTGTAVVTRD
ncbi:hypothetical protein ABIE44_001769 [Marmoricola sp. OAE513]|uniref:outer membrane protein assembly factor BamB family protein n=1 Tax=Marmoricola sp. OAE513 TaxID=2817894 RepID=UPI001AE0FC5D